MAKVSITAAAKLAGVSRSTLYRSYIDKGLLSVSKDQKGKRCIDTSELLRVFGALQGEAEQGDTSDSVGQSDATHPDSVGQSEKSPQSSESALALELKLTKKQLEESRSREEWYKKKIDDLTDTMKLLEHKPAPARPNRRWWQFMWK
jgi:DNA-binding transcriptional MerR regulator